MKKLLSAVLAAACVMVPACAAVAGEGNVQAHKMPAIEIDGSLDEWNLESSADIVDASQLVRDEGQWTDPTDLSLKVYTAWDEDYLYIGAEINDSTPFMYREGFPPDMADTLVLFFSTNPEADPARTEYEATDFRLAIVIDDYDDFYTGIDREMLDDTKGIDTFGEDGDEVFEDVIEGGMIAKTETETGCFVEIALPWSVFSSDEIAQFLPTAGTTIGFEVGMYDLDFPCPGVATARMQWTSDSMDCDTNPSLWGTLTFVE